MLVDLEKWKINTFENEQQFQGACVIMISQEFPKLRGKMWHVFNEGWFKREEGETDRAYEERRIRQGGKNKALGMLGGCPDLHIKYRGILYTIELKQPNGSLSPSQKDLHELWNRDCPQIPVMVARTLYEVYMYCKWIITNGYSINFQ